MSLLGSGMIMFCNFSIIFKNKWKLMIKLITSCLAVVWWTAVRAARNLNKKEYQSVCVCLCVWIKMKRKEWTRHNFNIVFSLLLLFLNWIIPSGSSIIPASLKKNNKIVLPYVSFFFMNICLAHWCNHIALNSRKKVMFYFSFSFNNSWFHFPLINSLSFSFKRFLEIIRSEWHKKMRWF